MIVSRVVLMIPNPLSLELLHFLGSLALVVLDQVSRCETHQEIPQISQTTHHVFLLLNLTAEVYYLQIELLVNLLHVLTLEYRLVSLALLIMRGQLILLNKS